MYLTLGVLPQPSIVGDHDIGRAKSLITAAEYREIRLGVVAATSPEILERYGILPKN
jgi:hypothetical protein